MSNLTKSTKSKEKKTKNVLNEKYKKFRNYKSKKYNSIKYKSRKYRSRKYKSRKYRSRKYKSKITNKNKIYNTKKVTIKNGGYFQNSQETTVKNSVNLFYNGYFSGDCKLYIMAHMSLDKDYLPKYGNSMVHTDFIMITKNLIIYKYINYYFLTTDYILIIYLIIILQIINGIIYMVMCGKERINKI